MASLRRRPRALIMVVMTCLVGLSLINMLVNKTNFGGYSRVTDADIEMPCTRWYSLVSTTKSCVLDAAETAPLTDPTAFWKGIDDLLDHCCTTVRDEIDLMLINNTDDTKGFVDFVKEAQGAECTVLTLGIGNDTTAEEKVKEWVPRCKFIGADPMPAQGEIYTKLGAFIPVAVSNETGIFTASVLTNYALQTYVTSTVLTIEFMEFLTKMAQLTVIDYMFFDAEGAEYPLLPYFMRGGELDRAGITVCQLSMEFHGHPKMGMPAWREAVIDFFRNSDYLPLWSGKAWPHLRTILINWRSSICIKKFYANICRQAS